MSILALALFILAPQEHGGRIDWVRDPDFGVQKARLEGRPAMLYFTASWCKYCKALGAGAFSDERVVAASQRVVPVYVDCTDKGQNAALLRKYGVDGFPAVIYTDPEGNRLREMETRDAGAIVAEIGGVASKFPGKPGLWQPGLKAADELGTKAKKPIALVLADSRTDLLKLTARLTKDLGDRKTKFLWVLEPAREEQLKKYGVESGTVIVVLDPRSDEVIARIAMKDDEKIEALHKPLDEAAKALKK